MYIPSGMTEAEVLAVIEKVVRAVSSYFKFGYYDIDDIKQEGRMFALEALPRFNPSKGASLYTFLRTHVRNRLINLKIRNTNKNASGDLVVGEISTDSNNELIFGEEIDLNERLHHKDIATVIDTHLPNTLRNDYLMWRDGINISKRKEVRLLETIKEILINHYGEKEFETWCS